MSLLHVAKLLEPDTLRADYPTEVIAGCSVVHMTIGLLGILLGGEQAS